MFVVIDTNILVSSLWSRDGAPAKIVSMILQGILVPCYDYRILCEYHDVLLRPKFQFAPHEVNSLLDWIESTGQSIIAKTSQIIFSDIADKKFFEVALTCKAILITGNLKHFPKSSLIQNASEFLKNLLSNASIT